MIRNKTYKNVLCIAKRIQEKGYSREESLELSLKVFDNMEQANNGMPAEWFADKIISKQEYGKQL